MSPLSKMDRFAPIKDAVLTAYNTGDYHDLILEVHGHQFQVHKVIVCLQSPWLAKEVNGRGKKSTGPIKLPESNTHVANALLRYLYSADYYYPVEVSHSFEVELPPEMLFHLELYALANSLIIDPLKALSQTRFRNVVERDWNTAVFPDAVRKVYKIATPESHGEQLRSVVVNIAAKHAKELLGSGGEFVSMMGDVAEFGKDVFQVMAGGTIALPPPVAEKTVTEEMVRYKCPVCPFEFQSKAVDKEEFGCLGCGAVNKEAEYRSTTNETVAEVKINGFHRDEVETESNGGGTVAKVEDDHTTGKDVLATTNGDHAKQNGHAYDVQPIGIPTTDIDTESVASGPSLKDVVISKANGVDVNDRVVELERNGAELKGYGVNGNGIANKVNGNGTGSSLEVKEVGTEAKEQVSAPKKKNKKSKRSNSVAQTPPAPPPPPPLEVSPVRGSVVNGRS